MKRLLALTFLLIMIPTTQSVAVAVTDEYCQEQSEIIDKKCQYFNGTHYSPVAGCEYDEEQKKCVACPIGFYGANCSDQCISDGVLDSIANLGITSWDGATGATTEEECSWWLTCPITSEWGGADIGCQECDNGFVTYEHRIGYADGTIEEENTNYTCQTCGANSTPDKSTSDNSAGACFCDTGYHIENSSYNATETYQAGIDCVPATYRIRIYKNRPWISNDTEYIDLYVQTGSNKLVQDTNTSDTTPTDNGRDTWFNQQSAISNWPTLDDKPTDGKTYELTTYNTAAGDTGTIYARPGNTYKGTTLTDDRDLYAQWNEISTYTVQYGNTTGPDTTSELKEIDTTKPHTVLNPFPCNLDTFTDEFYLGWNGKKFTGWTIYINDEYDRTISIKELQDGNKTVQGAAGYTIYLEGQTELCPAGSYCNPEQCYKNENEDDDFVYLCDEGYYCPEGSATQVKCPAGYYCETPETKVECTTPGSYCPQGSTEPTNCPAGYFCTTPATKTECPAGSYCPQDSTEPKDCPAGYYCPSTTTGALERTDDTPDDVIIASKCPVGSTTEKAGATAITDCGITSATQFKDNNSKEPFFNLTLENDDGFLSYKGQTNSI